MNDQQICFMNESAPAEKIIVCDAQSAETLNRVLAKLDPQKWVIQGREESRIRMSVVSNVPKTKELRVILISGTSTFRCATCDVSLVGMKLKNSVPASFTDKECTAYISHDDMRENIEMFCQVITDANGASSLQFVKPKKPDMQKLSEWMTEEAS